MAVQVLETLVKLLQAEEEEEQLPEQVWITNSWTPYSQQYKKNTKNIFQDIQKQIANNTDSFMLLQHCINLWSCK